MTGEGGGALILEREETARARGAKTLNGVGMMVQQGAINFTIWTGEEAPVDVMYEALSHELG